MISSNTVNEAVYYMDRSTGVLVTDRQVVVGEHRYDLSEVKGAIVEGRRTGECRRFELRLRAISLATLLGAFGIYLTLRGTALGSALFGADMLVFAGTLIILLVVGFAGDLELAVIIKRHSGRAEEVMRCRDSRRARLVARAVREAAADYYEERNPRTRRT